MSNQASSSNPEVPYSRPASPEPHRHQLGFVGIGNMSKRMALNLAKHIATLSPPLPPLKIWNRTTKKAKDLADESEGTIIAVDDLATIGKDCNIVFTSLSTDEAAKDVFQQLMKAEEEEVGTDKTKRLGLEHSRIYVDTSTLYPTTTGEIERMVSALPKRRFVAAPVFGPPPMAEKAQLVFATAGHYGVKRFVSQFLVPAMGRKILDFGSNPERASSMKLIGNSIILSTIEMLSESMTLAEKTGVGAEAIAEWVKEFFPAPSAIGYSQKILNNQFDGENGFTLSGGIKDAGHIRRLAESVDCPVPIVDTAHQHLVAARAIGRAEASQGKGQTSGERDWSSLVAGQRISAGLPPFEGGTEMLVKENK